MRETYNTSNQNSLDGQDFKWFEGREETLSKQEVVVPQEESYSDNNLKGKLINTYIDIESELQVAKREAMLSNNDIYSNSNVSNEERVDTSKLATPKKKGMSVGAIIAIVLSSLVMLSLLVVGGIFVVNKVVFNSDSKKAELANNTLIEVQNSVDMLYSDSLKTEIKDGYTVSDLDAFRKQLDEISSSVDCTTLLAEIDTIELYLCDKKTLTVYADLNYNIAPDFVGKDCENIISSSNSYTVDGLKATICNLATSITLDRDGYLAIKEELSAIKDVKKYNEEDYAERIDAIKHTVNKSELQSMSDKLEADRDEAKAKDALKNAKTEEDKKNAEEDLKDAQGRQESIKEDLEGIYNSLKELIEGRANTATEPSSVALETTNPSEITKEE